MNNLELADVVSVIGKGILDGVPAVEMAATMLKAAQNVHDQYHLKKVLAFVEASQELSAAQRNTLHHELMLSAKDVKYGELIFSYLEKAESTNAAKYIGRALYLLGIGRITAEEFWAVSFAFSVIPNFALITLRKVPNDQPNPNQATHCSEFVTIFAAAGVAESFITIDGSAFIYRGRIPKIIYAIREDSIGDIEPPRR